MEAMISTQLERIVRTIERLEMLQEKHGISDKTRADLAEIKAVMQAAQKRIEERV